MTCGKMLTRSILFFCAAGVAIAAAMKAGPAASQPYYSCPAGYSYTPGYGCLPVGYVSGPPNYVYPSPGFNFFYGGGWGPGYHYGSHYGYHYGYHYGSHYGYHYGSHHASRSGSHEGSHRGFHHASGHGGGHGGGHGRG
jgi:hypothetical protein